MARRTNQTVRRPTDWSAVADAEPMVTPPPSFAKPAFPYENTAKPVLNPFGQPITQAAFDALQAENDRLKRLCQTHGLMI